MNEAYPSRQPTLGSGLLERCLQILLHHSVSFPPKKIKKDSSFPPWSSKAIENPLKEMGYVDSE